MITHVFHDAVYLNVRTIEDDEFQRIAEALCRAEHSSAEMEKEDTGRTAARPAETEADREE